MSNIDLPKKLKQLGFNDDNIFNIMLRKDVSPLVNRLLEKIDENTTLEDRENILLELLLSADTMKPITCNKDTLSKLTGLSKRQIDEKRRSRLIPCIQITGQTDGAGRKIILFDPNDFKKEILQPKYKINKISA